MKTHTRTKILTGIAAAMLLLLPMPACSDSNGWVSLDEGLPEVSASLLGFSLAAGPRVQPALGLESADNGGVTVLRWHRKQWEAVGSLFPGASGPMLAIDADHRLLLCTSGKYAGTGAPNVFRWQRGAWTAIGGDIAAEAGYRSAARHVVDACGGMALTEAGDPVVTWTAEVGAKSWAVFAARWDAAQARWLAMGEGAVAGGRSVSTHIAVDGRDRVYLATTTTVGAGTARTTTAQAWRWNGGSWEQMGPDIVGGEDAVIGIRENQPYLALRSAAQATDTGLASIDEMQVLRWHRSAWEPLPSPGVGIGPPSLAFTSSGRPVVAYAEPRDGGQTLAARVWQWAGKGWRSMGEPAASVTCSIDSCFPEAWLDLSLDALGRPVIAWKDRSYTLGADGSWLPTSRLLVQRYRSSERKGD